MNGEQDEKAGKVHAEGDKAGELPGSAGGRRFWLTLKVLELRLRFIALMAATGLVFAYWETVWNWIEKQTRPAPSEQLAASQTEFFCPMHPSVIRADPGGCPICGMPLSRRNKGEKAAAGTNAVRVQLSPRRILQAGIRTEEVGFEPLVETFQTVGFVTVDERRVARVSSKTRGLARIEKLFVDFTGTSVTAGQPLVEVYSPELNQVVRELLLAQRTASFASAPRAAGGQVSLSGGADLLALGREKLLLWGLSSTQIDEILARGKASDRIPIQSPIGGVVMRKYVVEGQYVAEGDPLFDVVDLAQVWILAQVFEDQLPRVRLGQRVEASFTAFPGRSFPGEVAFIEPAVDPATRTVNVRYDLPNPGGELRPGMYATVRLHTPVAESPAFRERAAERRGRRPRVVRAGLSVEAQEICPVTRAKLGSMGEPVRVELPDSGVWVCCRGCAPRLKSAANYFVASERSEQDPAGVVSVAEEAVIDRGDQQYVYVETEPGVFEGRRVVLGPRIGNRFPVFQGLEPGERVAAAGAFLVDAESRLSFGSADVPAETGLEVTAAKRIDPPSGPELNDP